MGPLIATNPEAQIPIIQNPGRFNSDETWSDAKRSHKKEKYSQTQEQYKTFIVINQVTVLLLEEIFNKDHWSNLNTGNDYDDNLSARTILEHMEAKYHKEQPIDI